MAKRLIWMEDAQNDRKEIFEFFNNRNKSKKYSLKLNKLFLSAISRILKNNEIGIQTTIFDVRTILVKDYQLVYKISEKEIIILNIWDCRQNPENFYKNIRK